MSKAEAIKPGDRVRVTTEGVVREASRVDVHFEGGNFVPIWPGTNVEVVERRKPRAGDVFFGYDLAAADLPFGTVVQHGSGTVRMKQRDGRWPSGEAYTDRLATESRYTIRFIPGPTS